MNKSLNNDGASSAIVARFLAIRSEYLSKSIRGIFTILHNKDNRKLYNRQIFVL